MRLPAMMALALLCAALRAQAIDAEASRFLSEPQARPGTCAPYRLQFAAPAGSTAEVEIQWGSVLLRRVVAVAQSPVRVVLPVPASAGVRVTVRVGEDQAEHRPTPPPRSAAASHSQPYLAVFAGDSMYARAILPTQPGRMLADYFEVSEFFADWRLADGYDAIILFNPDDARLPSGAQRAIAEYCSLGGVLFVAGSFRFGEQAADLPAPGEPRPLTIRDVALQRFEYGPGAIYRCEWDALRRSRSAQAVVMEAVADHLWRGATEAPGGPAPTRAAPAALPLLVPGSPVEASPGAAFWVLLCVLVLGACVLPVVIPRLVSMAAAPAAGVFVFAAATGGLAALQPGPAPVADLWSVASNGPRPGGPMSLRGFVVAQPGLGEWKIDLDAPGPRILARPLPDIDGKRAWVVDVPLAAGSHGRWSSLRSGAVDGVPFRDFATEARLGGRGYDVEQGRLLDWWLDQQAWRGRLARLGPAEASFDPVPPGGRARPRGAIAVTLDRHDDGN